MKKLLARAIFVFLILSSNLIAIKQDEYEKIINDFKPSVGYVWMSNDKLYVLWWGRIWKINENELIYLDCDDELQRNSTILNLNLLKKTFPCML